jgi:3-oxoacyl-[acyl-carrier protein] reductase
MNKVVIITGSSRGIGKSIAVKLAKEGANVVVNGRDEKAVLAVVNEIRKDGGKAIAISGAIEHMETGERLVEAAVSTFGKVDVLINNAGIVRDSMSYRMSEEDWDEVIAVHLKGAFSATKPFIIEVRKQGSGGHIINMTSTAGLEGTIGQLNYSAAKAGLLGMTWTLAKELLKDGVRVNAIAPAALTDMTRPVIEKAKQHAKEAGKELDPYWNVGSAEDVACFVTDLISYSDMKITGEVFSVNGIAIGRWRAPQYEWVSDDRDRLWDN